ncbi:hypothetical protein DSO57_1024396 [Entomophthora muscae]|uniref:Uncharacterized protein n=1 Tax=Entomophthora muscae TaxID=34485 RepID=A0ACC2SFI2_9FUNG|nr:hypothetical protein DSO57_1024396 [Entomophthora muscae]
MLSAEQFLDEKKHIRDEHPSEEPGLDHQDSSEASEKEYSDPCSPTSEAKEVDSRFFDRLNAIPLVAEGVGYVQKYANSGESIYSKYIKLALTKAEVGLQTVSELAESKFPTHLEAADNLGVRSLDFLEDKFPTVLKQTSSDVIKQSRDAISSMVATPQAAISSTIDSIASNAEGILDRFLPPAEEAQEAERDVGVARLRHVGVDASRRLTKVVRSQMSSLSTANSNQSILNLSESKKFFQRAAEEMSSLNEKLQATLNATKDNVSSIKDSSLQYLIKSQNQLVQRINSEVNSISLYLKENAGDKPETLRKQLEPAVAFFSTRYTKVSAEFQNDEKPLSLKARNALLLATDSIPIIDDACRYLTSFLARSDDSA